MSWLSFPLKMIFAEFVTLALKRDTNNSLHLVSQLWGEEGGREEDNLQWTWFPSSGISNIFCHLVPQNWDKLQLDGLHGSGVDLFKVCLSGKFYFPCVAIFNNLIIINFHVCCFIPLLLLNGNLFYICVTLQSYKKTFPAIPQKKNSLKDSLVHLVSFITHFVYWWIE